MQNDLKEWGSRDFPSKNDKVLWRPLWPWPPEGYYFSLTGKSNTPLEATAREASRALCRFWTENP